MNVVDAIVSKDYCIGCGMCVPVCPKNNLIMNWSESGELNPFIDGECNISCSVCLDVCPFFDHNINQNDIAKKLYSNSENKYNSNVGYYNSCYVGYALNDDLRDKGASGGMATWLLSSLIDNKLVDKIVAVGTSSKEDKLFDFKILRTSDDIKKCSGSFYYPVEISKIIKYILEEDNNDSYAIIGLPCLIYSLRLAMSKFPRLNRKIKYLFSLTCGQLQNKYCTELLAVESGININDLQTMDYRRKNSKDQSSNFSQVPIDKNGNEGIYHSYHDLPFYLWNYRFFTHNSCNYCDDVFGELADVVFMDAWLPEYLNDYKGHSLIVVRNRIFSEIFNKGKKENSCVIDDISILSVEKSQKGVIFKKRDLIAGRLYKSEINNVWHPKKRINSDRDIYLKNKRFIDLTDKIRILSKNAWYESKGSSRIFWKKMLKMRLYIKFHEFIILLMIKYNEFRKIIWN